MNQEPRRSRDSEEPHSDRSAESSAPGVDMPREARSTRPARRVQPASTSLAAPRCFTTKRHTDSAVVGTRFKRASWTSPAPRSNRRMRSSLRSLRAWYRSSASNERRWSASGIGPRYLDRGSARCADTLSRVF